MRNRKIRGGEPAAPIAELAHQRRILGFGELKRAKTALENAASVAIVFAHPLFRSNRLGGQRASRLVLHFKGKQIVVAPARQMKKTANRVKEVFGWFGFVERQRQRFFIGSESR